MRPVVHLGLRVSLGVASCSSVGTSTECPLQGMQEHSPREIPHGGFRHGPEGNLIHSLWNVFAHKQRGVGRGGAKHWSVTAESQVFLSSVSLSLSVPLLPSLGLHPAISPCVSLSLNVSGPGSWAAPPPPCPWALWHWGQKGWLWPSRKQTRFPPWRVTCSSGTNYRTHTAFKGSVDLSCEMQLLTPLQCWKPQPVGAILACPCEPKSRWNLGRSVISPSFKGLRLGD